MNNVIKNSNMRSTFRLMPYINKAKTRADGATAVMLRITIDGKKTVMATGIYCEPDKWDAKKGIRFGNDYRFFLKRTTRLSSVTINRCQVWMSRLVYRAVDKGILRSNPLEDMEYEKRDDDKNEVHYLTREQVHLLMSHPFEGKRMEFARRMLVFTIFTGLAYIDLKSELEHRRVQP